MKYTVDEIFNSRITNWENKYISGNTNHLDAQSKSSNFYNKNFKWRINMFSFI